MKRGVLKYNKVQKNCNEFLQYAFREEEIKLLDMDTLLNIKFFERAYHLISPKFRDKMIKNYLAIKLSEFVIKKYNEEVIKSPELVKGHPEWRKKFKI